MSIVHPYDLVGVSESFRTKVPNTSLISALPVDIEYAIFDQVSNQFGALQACSLVCHGWRSITKPSLFRSVCVDLERDVGFKRIRKSPPDPKGLHAFLDFLDGSPDIVGYVHNVRIRSGQGFLLSLGGFIPLLLLKVPHLRTLAVSSLSLGRRDESRLPSTVDPPEYDVRQFPCVAIDTLDISSCYFYGLRPLYDILRTFSRIGQLNIQGSNAEPTCDSLGYLDPSTVPMIKSVVLDFPASHHHHHHRRLLPFLFSILRTSSLSNGVLKSIRCLASKNTLEHFLVLCLEDECGHLRELHLDIESFTFEGEEGFFVPYWHVLRTRIASRSALECITVTVDGNRGVHRVSSAYVNALRAVFWTSAHLVCPPPPSVRSIVHIVREGFETDDVEDAVEAIAAGEHWGWLDAALCDHRPLTRFAFVFENAYGDGSMAEEDRVRLTTTLERLFPNLRERGVLRVELTAQENTRRA